MHNSVAMVKSSSTSARARSVHRQRKRIIHQILKQQRNTDLVIPRASFNRVAREISDGYGEFNFRDCAMLALQWAAEEYMTEIFSDAARLALYNRRDTVVARDVIYVSNPAVLTTREDVEATEVIECLESEPAQVQ